MQVNKIQVNPIPQTKFHKSQSVSNPQLICSSLRLSRGIDAKSYVNIAFRGEKELLCAAKNGYLETVCREIENGTDVNTKEPYYFNTPLIYACWNGHTEIVKELLQCLNIDVNITTRFDSSALILAASHGHTEIVKLLIERDDTDVNLINVDENTAITAAINSGNVDTIKELLKHPNIDLSIKYRNQTPLELAECRYGYSDITKMVEEYQPGVDRRDNKSGVIKKNVNIEKLSPEENIWTKEVITNKFGQLIETKRYDVAERMLQVTPLIDLDGNDRKILNEICKIGDSVFAEKVFDYKRNQSQMQKEYDTRRKEFFEKTIKGMSYDELKASNIALNTIDGFKVLMEKPEFNPNDITGKMSLFERTCLLDPEGNLAKEILSNYYDIYTYNAAKIKNKNIKDLIENYEKIGKYKIILDNIENISFDENGRNVVVARLYDLLQSSEFNPLIVDSVGNNLIHIAATLPDDSAKMLIQKSLMNGVNINEGNVTGQRPLMSAIKAFLKTKDENEKRNLMANIKFLLDKGADVNAQDNSDNTACHFVCRGTSAVLLKLLLSKNPNVCLLDKAGKRADKYLRTEEMKEMFRKYLIG